MAFLKEFKEFALKGNVMDMAVGVIIGGAFGKIVSSLVNDILMPPIGALIGNTDFSQLRLDISKFRDMTSSAVHAVGDAVTGGGETVAQAAAEPVYWNYGAFITGAVQRGAVAHRNPRSAQRAEEIGDIIPKRGVRPIGRTLFCASTPAVRRW